MRGGKHVKVKKRRHQDILRFRADERKLILGSIGTPIDHLSVKAMGITTITYQDVTNMSITNNLKQTASVEITQACHQLDPRDRVRETSG